MTDQTESTLRVVTPDGRLIPVDCPETRDLVHRYVAAEIRAARRRAAWRAAFARIRGVLPGGVR